MTVKQIVALIRKHQPKDVGHLMRITGLSTKYIGRGAYRYVYNLGDRCVVKFPTADRNVVEALWRLDYAHSKSEWKINEAINAAQKGDKFYRLKPHSPKLIYFSGRTGLVLAPRYRLLERGDKRIPALRKLVHSITGHKSDDIKYGNVGVNADGDSIILDLGCIEHGEE